VLLVIGLSTSDAWQNRNTLYFYGQYRGDTLTLHNGWKTGSESLFRSHVAAMQGCANIPEKQQNPTYGGTHCATKRW